MQKDRKSKIAEAYMARRKKQLACYLASTLGAVVSTSFCTMPALAFDVPPATQSKTVYMGPVDVGPVTSGNVGNVQVSNSEALKRVGIRFVGPENALKHNNTSTDQRTAGQPLPQSREVPQTPKVIQPPIMISGAGTASKRPGANDSSTAGIRIRIPSDKPISTNLPSAEVSPASVHGSAAGSSSGSPFDAAGVASLKMTVGTGVATQPINTTGVNIAGVSIAKPAFDTIPVVESPKIPPMIVSTPQASLAISAPTPLTQTLTLQSIAATLPGEPKPIELKSGELKSGELKSSDSVALQTPSLSRLQAKLQDSSTMTSRAPGIVRIPSMVVSGASQFSASKVNSTASVATAQSIPTPASPTPAFVSGGSSKALPSIDLAQTQVMHSRAPSIESSKRSSTHADTSYVPAPSTIASNTGFHALPSTVTRPANLPRAGAAVNTETLAPTANRSMELADRELGSSGPYSSGSKLMDATARASTRHEPSIIPVTLVSTASKESIASNVAASTDELLNSSTQLNVETTPLPTTSTITVTLKNVQSIRLPGKISQVEIEDDTICRVISTEPSTLTIIGASIGDSKITVWSTNPLTKADESQNFRISVRETWGQAAKNTVSIDDVNQSIAALFPGSTIMIKPNSDGSISVQGNATSNESAKQILMLVRKMFLVPVQDRIAIANL